MAVQGRAESDAVETTAMEKDGRRESRMRRERNVKSRRESNVNAGARFLLREPSLYPDALRALPQRK